MKNKNLGFSLVELIIVIAIMAVIIGTLAPQFLKQVEKSRESRDLQNIEEYKVVIEAIAADKEEITGSMEIEISSAEGTFVNVSDPELQKYGLASTFELSSKKWTDFTWTYDKTNYIWSLSDNTGATYYHADGTSK